MSVSLLSGTVQQVSFSLSNTKIIFEKYCSASCTDVLNYINELSTEQL